MNTPAPSHPRSIVIKANFARIRPALVLTCFLTLALQARATTFVSGNISGTWTKTGSPYIATANLTVPSGQTLAIQPGVTVIIGQELMIDVEGTISATGTAAERIVIRGANSTLYWDKIYINDTGSSQSILSNCTISDGSNAIHMNINGSSTAGVTMNPSIANCIFLNCQISCVYGYSHGKTGYSSGYVGLNTNLAPLIKNCLFMNSGNGCVFSTDGSRYQPPGGSYVYGRGSANPKITNCVFNGINDVAVQFSAGSDAGTSYPEIQNNAIVQCATAMLKSSSTMFNDILSYNCFYDNTANFVGYPVGIYGTISGTNARGSGCDLAYNIFENPLFAETVNYTLANNSPCIDAGNPDTAYLDTTLPPSKGTSVNDMGIYGGPNAGNWGSNSAPVITAIAAQTANEGLALNFTVGATDADLPANTLTYSLIGAPSGASINPATGLFEWTPTEGQGPGSFSFTVQVSDGFLVDGKIVNVTVSEVNVSPVLSAITAKTVVDESVSLAFTASATDADIPANALAYSLVSAPPGAGIDASTGEFSWTPTEAQGPGIFDFMVRVTDGLATSDQPVSIIVNELNTAPVIADIPEKLVDEAATLGFTASATDTDLPANNLTYSLGTGTPPGATIDPSSGVLSWNAPSVAADTYYTIRVVVSDNGSPALSDFKDVGVLVRVVDDVIQWQREKFGSDADDPAKQATVWGDNADPDQDGTGNLLEFMMARNPMLADENLGPKFRIENGKAIMTYRETKLIDHGVYLFGNWSPDLGMWLYAGLEYVPVADQGDNNLMEMRMPINGQKRLFQRLEVFRAY